VLIAGRWTALQTFTIGAPETVLRKKSPSELSLGPHTRSVAPRGECLQPGERSGQTTCMTVHQVRVETDISAPPQRVWDLITDITLMPRFSSELQSAEWDDGFDSPRLGARFLGTNRHPAIGEWTTLCVVTCFEVPRSFGWAVGDGDEPAATWRFDIEPTGAQTRLHYTAQLGDGPSGVTMLIDRDPGRADEIIAKRLRQWRAGMAATLAGFKELAETG